MKHTNGKNCSKSKFHLTIDWSDEFLCDEMSVWQNVRVTKCLVTKCLVTKCHVTKCLCDEMSMWRNVLWRNVIWRNVRVTICQCDQMSCDELSVWRIVCGTKCQCDELSVWPNCCDELSSDELSCDEMSGSPMIDHSINDGVSLLSFSFQTYEARMELCFFFGFTVEFLCSLSRSLKCPWVIPM